MNWYENLPGSVWGDEGKTSTSGIGVNTAVKPVAAQPVNSGMGTPQSYYQQGMSAIGEMAAGTSPIYKSIENRATQGFGGAQIAAIGAAKQGAAQAGYTPEGIGSVEQTTVKNLEGERSKMLGEISGQKQQLATTAASQLVSGGLSGMGQQLAERAQGFAETQYADTQKQTRWDRMLETYDPSTPEGLRSLQTGYVSLFGGAAPDLNTITEQRNYVRTKQQQDVAMGGIGVTQAEQAVRDTNLASTMNMVTAGYSVDRINDVLGTNYTQDEWDQFRENTDTYFRSKGIDMQEATIYGYTDENGNHVAGALEIAAGQFGLQTSSYEDQKKELYGYIDENGNRITGRYEQLSSADKRAADAAYGYDTTDADGNRVHVMGTLELANSADAISRQGLSLTEAQIKGYLDPTTGDWVKGSVQIAAERQGMEVSSLYGYYYDPDTGEVITDPNEISRRGNDLEHVDGALVLSGKQFGLSEKTLDMQQKELYGYTDESTGEVIKGRMQILNAEDQRAANQLYGYTDETTGKHVAGSLEVMSDELEIRKQGLTLDEARLFGYDKDGTHVAGVLEIENERMGIVRQEADKQASSDAGQALASYFQAMKNVTGWNPRTDAQADKLLQAYWEASGNTGMYDMAWADNQVAATTISQTDAALANLEKEQWYKDLDPKMQEQVKQVAGIAAMLSVTQGAVPVYNETGDIVGLNDSEGNTIWKMPTETEGEQSGTRGTAGFKFASKSEEDAAWKAIQKEAQDYNINIDRQEWEESGYPTIEAYKTGISGLNSIKIESYSDLLSVDNSKKVWDAYSSDPEGFTTSKYYYAFPGGDIINKNITTTTSRSGVRTTSISDSFRKTLDDSVGKITTFELTEIGKTNPNKTGETITGQIVSYKTTPATAVINIKMSDGTTKSVSISPARLGNPTIQVL